MLQYPCLIYERKEARKFFADNGTYIWRQGYTVTYIDYDPDSDVVSELMIFPYSEYDRHFSTSGLNHDVFTIYH